MGSLHRMSNTLMAPVSMVANTEEREFLDEGNDFVLHKVTQITNYILQRAAHLPNKHGPPTLSTVQERVVRTLQTAEADGFS
jgi:hypothetical protein